MVRLNPKSTKQNLSSPSPLHLLTTLLPLVVSFCRCRRQRLRQPAHISSNLHLILPKDLSCIRLGHISLVRPFMPQINTITSNLILDITISALIQGSSEPRIVHFRPTTPTIAAAVTPTTTLRITTMDPINAPRFPLVPSTVDPTVVRSRLRPCIYHTTLPELARMSRTMEATGSRRNSQDRLTTSDLAGTALQITPVRNPFHSFFSSSQSNCINV